MDDLERLRELAERIKKSVSLGTHDPFEKPIAEVGDALLTITEHLAEVERRLKVLESRDSRAGVER